MQGQFENFLAGLRGNLNNSITRDDAIDTLAQHLITRPVFDALFEGYSFTEHNPVSQVMQHMLNALDEYDLVAENETLEDFYASVRMRAEGIDNAEGKQRIITELYERFFKIAFPRAAESLGIVYTPVEVVDFILRSVEHVLNTDFDASISDPGVHVLDPFTGTGTFVVRLLQSGLIKPQDLLRKYAEELHANELLLLAYYIAAINIEATFHGLTGQPYTPFNGIVLTDTFQMTEDGDTMDELIFPTNNERVAHQKSLDIRVILGNPPYSVGQSLANDNNANLKYPTLDDSITRTYAAQSAASLKISLFDSYVRAIRWASDRILSSANGGVIAFVTNGGYIESNTADGLRKALSEEFHAVHVFNLRGNQRTAGEASRREGGKIFGSGSRATVAVLVLVKRPGQPEAAAIRYRDIGEYLDRDEKLAVVAKAGLTDPEWQEILPNAAGDWINQRNEDFESFTPLGLKLSKGQPQHETIFGMYSAGLKTNRDAWVYNSSRVAVEGNVRRMIDYYNAQRELIAERRRLEPGIRDKEILSDWVGRDAASISWDGTAEADLLRNRPFAYDPDSLVEGLYRPFQRQFVYFNRQLNNSVYQLGRIFPRVGLPNVGIMINGIGTHHAFAALMTDAIPNLHLLHTGQFFPRYVYEPVGTDADLFSDSEAGGFRRLDNITDRTLIHYRSAYGQDVTKDDIFSYVYGLLHSPDYRTRYASDLKKTLARVPMVSSSEDFVAFARAGYRLGELHTHYERAEPYPLDEIVTGPSLEVRKMQHPKVSGTADRTTIVINGSVSLRGIPLDAYEYFIGTRSALEWLVDRYQVRVDPESGIVNNPNDWCDEVGDPRYVIDLVKRIVTVSVETVRIVNSLPPLEIE